MLADKYIDAISNDWLWREKELRDLDAVLLKSRNAINLKAAILIIYAHWEGHFKVCATELLTFISVGVERKHFRWTDINPVRYRLLFCSYRLSSLAGQRQDTFISYLNALNDARYTDALKARDEIVMVDDNLNSTRAEAICRNLGVDPSWCVLKRIIIDERLIEWRNAIAHGSQRLKTGDLIDFKDDSASSVIDDTRALIREAKNRFSNSIVQQSFLAIKPP